MARTVRIQNISSSDDVELVCNGMSYPVPPFGFLTVSYVEYIDISVQNDIVSMPLVVSISDELMEKASVKDFGAVGDGAADDTIPIQSAIDYIASCGGGIIDFPVGVYLVNGLSITENTVLQGESKDNSVLKMMSYGSCISFMSSGGLDKMKLVRYGAIGEEDTAVSLNGGYRVSVSDSSFDGFSVCFDIGGGGAMTVRNCSLSPVAVDDRYNYYRIDQDGDSMISESFCDY